MVVSPAYGEVLVAVRALDPDLPWRDVAPLLVPCFPRRRPMPFPEQPVYLERPPGVRVGIGVDIGPAFLHVSEPLLERWSQTADAAFERALSNVRALAEQNRFEPVAVGPVGEVQTKWFQSGEHYASPLLLMPDQIERRFGRDPQFVLAPMRDLLVSLPMEAGFGFATWLRESVQEEDPNCLELPVFTFIDGLLRIASQEPAAPGWAATRRGLH